MGVTLKYKIMKTKQDYSKEVAELRGRILKAKSEGNTELAGNLGLQLIKLMAEAIRASSVLNTV